MFFPDLVDKIPIRELFGVLRLLVFMCYVRCLYGINIGFFFQVPVWYGHQEVARCPKRTLDSPRISQVSRTGEDCGEVQHRKLVTNVNIEDAITEATEIFEAQSAIFRTDYISIYGSNFTWKMACHERPFLPLGGWVYEETANGRFSWQLEYGRDP